MMNDEGIDSFHVLEELVPIGEIDPNHIHTPGIFVQRIFEGKNYEKRIERRTIIKN